MGGRVYVHCEKGCSRSPSVVVQFLMEFRGFALLQAADFLKSRRCRVSPNGGFIDALVLNEQQLRREGRLLEDCAAERADTTGETCPETETPAVAASPNYTSDVIAVFRRPWLSDFRAGRVKPQPVDRIL